ncbi:hypothetical protein KDA00_05615 [Candidatus Saccharibacteria bacterium]|nr:hypothetical protein [Candidatus Saccharibacteria bacterium]
MYERSRLKHQRRHKAFYKAHNQYEGNTMDYKALAVRGLKTFIQGFLAYLSAGVAGIVDTNTLKALLVGAIAAGISAAMNIVLKPTEAR